MKNLMVLIYLRDDLSNTLERRWNYMSEEGICPSREKRDGVTHLSANATVFHLPKAHGVFVQVCAGLISAKLPYLVFPVQSTEDWIVSGTIPQEVANSLKTLGVAQTSP